MSAALIASTVGGALLGGIAGAQGNRAEQVYRRELLPESELEKYTGTSLLEGLKGFESLIGVGPGEQDIAASVASSRALADLLSQYSQGGFLPTQVDMARATELANAMFAPQQTALNQRFEEMATYANRQAARMGRSANDPILLNKLLQEQTRQQAQLDSQRGSYMMEQAWNLPQQRLNFASQLAQVQSGLASQALANRQALLSLGSQLRAQEQNFRTANATTIGTTTSGGGLAGALTGALAGLGSGAQLAGTLGFKTSIKYNGGGAGGGLGGVSGGGFLPIP